MKYSVTYLTGSGTEHHDGVWNIKRTPKTVTATKIEEYMSGIYAMHKVGEKFKIGNGTGNPIKDENGTDEFTVYFKQAGTPYIFKRIIEIPVTGTIDSKTGEITYK